MGPANRGGSGRAGPGAPRAGRPGRATAPHRRRGMDRGPARAPGVRPGSHHRDDLHRARRPVQPPISAGPCPGARRSPLIGDQPGPGGRGAAPAGQDRHRPDSRGRDRAGRSAAPAGGTLSSYRVTDFGALAAGSGPARPGRAGRPAAGRMAGWPSGRRGAYAVLGTRGAGSRGTAGPGLGALRQRLPGLDRRFDPRPGRPGRRPGRRRLGERRAGWAARRPADSLTGRRDGRDRKGPWSLAQSPLPPGGGLCPGIRPPGDVNDRRRRSPIPANSHWPGGPECVRQKRQAESPAGTFKVAGHHQRDHWPWPARYPRDGWERREGPTARTLGERAGRRQPAPAAPRSSHRAIGIRQKRVGPSRRS